MKSQLHVALGMLAAVTVFAGCQGGATVGNGGATPVGPGTTPTPVFSLAPGQTPTPTATLTPVGATPSPTPTPSSAVTGAIYHPASNGSTFTMNGTLLVTFDRSNQYPSPEPLSTTMYGVTQSVAVTNPASFNGASNAVDFKISETDTEMPSGQTFSDTMDDYFQFSGTTAAGNFLNLGYNSVDDTGYTVNATNGANDQLADILPETTGASWSNMGGHAFSTNDGNGETSSTSYKDDGSYTGTITYQTYPDPSGTATARTNTATLTANIDGSADYKTPRLGTTFVDNYDYALSAPSGTTIAETTTIPPAAGGTPDPVSTSIPNWQPASMAGKFYQETDKDNGPVPLPSPCIVPSGYSSGANQIVQTKITLDPLNGELETTTTTTYDTVNVGPICVIIHDVQDQYYDFSGQNGAGYFSGTPQQITTIDEVLYLSLETLQSSARRSFAQDRQFRSVNIPMAQARIASLRSAQRLNRLASAMRGRASRQSFRSFRGLLK